MNIAKSIVPVLILIIAVTLITNNLTASHHSFEIPSPVSEYHPSTYNLTYTNGLARITNGIDVNVTNANPSTLLSSYILNNTSIWVGSKEIPLTNAIYISQKTNFSLYGSGNESSFKMVGSEELISISQTINSTIRGIGLIGNGNYSQELTGIASTQNLNLKIQRNIIQNVGYDGFFDLWGSNNTLAEENTILYCGDDGLNAGGGGATGTVNSVQRGNFVAFIVNDGIHISQDSSNGLFYNNTVLNCSYGIGFYGTTHNEVYSNFVKNVNVAISEHTPDCDFNQVHNNYFLNYVTKSEFVGIHSSEYANTWRS